MDPNKNYIKLAGQPVQEIEDVTWHCTYDPQKRALTYRPVPPPEKSLEEEVREELNKAVGGNWMPTELKVLCHVIEGRLKALKE